MNKNERLVLNNLLNRISKNSYPTIEEILNSKIKDLNEEHIGGLLTIFYNEINTGKAASNELANEILQYVDYASEEQVEYSLMQLELNNYNLRELETFVKNQIDLLNKPLSNSQKKKIKSKKEFI